MVRSSGNDKIWWDEENKQVHKKHEFKSKEEVQAYIKEIGQSIKNGAIDVKSLDPIQKMGMFAISQ